MKKKHRYITVDDVKYVWIPGRYYCTVYKDRKQIVYFEDDGPITPSMIAAKIRQSLNK